MTSTEPAPPDAPRRRIAANSNLVRSAALLLVVVAWYTVLAMRPGIMARLGADHLGVWFMDTRAVLAASDAHAQGLDRHAPNPLDLLRQPHVYSDWWFELHHLGLDRSDHGWLGAALGFAFLVAAVAQAQVRGWADVALAAAVLGSPPFVLGFNRGNVDLFVFLLLSLVPPALAAGSGLLRLAGLALVAMAAGLKFYPAVAMVLLLALDRPRGEAWSLLGLAAGCLGVIALDQAESLALYAADAQAPFGFFTFGASVSPQLLGLAPAWGTALALLVFTGAMLRAGRAPPPPAPATVAEFQFLLGTVLLLGCYLATINFSYRLIFAAWLLPKLLADARAPAPGARRIGRLALTLLVVVLWADGAVCLALNLGPATTAATVDRWMRLAMLLQQPLVLALLACLLALAWPRLQHGAARLFGARPAA